MHIAAYTTTGRVRENNEDAYWYDVELSAMAIADGMGGHNGGEVASYLAAHGFGLLYRHIRDKHSESGIEPDMEEITICLDRLVFNTAQAREGLRGMGTTLVGSVYHGDMLHLVHTGDSRAAFVSPAGQIRWLTTDHNYAQYLVNKNEMTVKEARMSHYRHQITAYVGQGNGYGNGRGNHYQKIHWPDEHILLLCTDGLLDDTSDRNIGQLTVSGSDTLETRCQKLTEYANSKGGRDNCTVILAVKPANRNSNIRKRRD